MEKYFVLLLNKKNRIKSLEQSLNDINIEITKANEKEELYTSRYQDEIKALEVLTREQEERNIKCKILNIFLVITLIIIIGAILFSSIGLSILNVIIASISLTTIILGIEYLTLKIAKSYYEVLRVLDSEEIKNQKLNIIEAHNRILKISKGKEHLNLRKNRIRIELNKEKNDFENLTNQIIEKYAPLLDCLIEKGLEADYKKDYEPNLKLMKKLIENSCKNG